ncbi:hypothetical protein CBW53_03055 [Yersinia frederiksenii]|nr:hypothetical protein CBW53_03055 [Yersinia frederiksenii]
MNKFSKIHPLSDSQYKDISPQDASQQALLLTKIAAESGQTSLLQDHLALLIPIMNKARGGPLVDKTSYLVGETITTGSVFSGSIASTALKSTSIQEETLSHIMQILVKDDASFILSHDFKKTASVIRDAFKVLDETK